MNDAFDLDKTLRSFFAGQHVFNRYTLIRQLGRGGMGLVWLANDEQLDQEVALKFLPEIVASDAAAIDDLKRETKKALRLTHTNIVRTYDFFQEKDMAAISMEYVDGKSLTDLRIEQPNRVFSCEQIKPWVEQLCKALDYAHTKSKIAHRDLKPSNILLTSDGDIKITDFGISATIADTTTRVSMHASSSGTPVYMSPQQMMGEKAAPTDDIYSLGTTIYELLTSKPPFYSGNIIVQLQNKVPPTMRERRKELEIESIDTIPQEWENAIASCLAKAPEERPQNLDEFTSLLVTTEKETPTSKPQDIGEFKTVLVTPEEIEEAAQEEQKETTPPEEPEKEASSQSIEKQETSKPNSKGFLYTAVFAIIALMLTGGGYYYFNHFAPQKQARQLVKEAQRLEQKKAIYDARSVYDQVLKIEHADIETKQAALDGKNRLSKAGSLIIKTIPEGAKVLLGGKEQGISPTTFNRLYPGKYTLYLSKEGYDTKKIDLSILPEELLEPKPIQLVRQTGSLNLKLSPSNTKWKFRKTPEEIQPQNTKGFGSQTIKNLPTGNYEIEIEAPNWKQIKNSLIIEANKELIYANNFPLGDIELKSNLDDTDWKIIGLPPEANLSKTQGTTPYKLTNIPAGKYDVQYTKSGWKSITKTIVVEDSQTALAKAYWPKGGLVIKTIPTDAEVKVGTITAGNSPLTVSDLKMDTYPVKIHLDGFDDWEGHITLEKADEFTKKTIKLVRHTGSITIKGNTRNISWAITNAPDIKNLRITSGKTPCTLDKLPIGTYTFRLYKDGFKDISITKEIKNRSETSINAHLEVFNGPAYKRDWIIPKDGIQLVWIDPGTFLMGSPKSERNHSSDETQHRVTISKGYWLGKYEITQGQWENLMGTNVRQMLEKAKRENENPFSNFASPYIFGNPSSNAKLNGEGKNNPMYYVSWTDAYLFCKKLTKQERAAGRLPDGYEYALPTEAQWEYACRAGSTDAFTGNGIWEEISWYKNNSGGKTHPVGQKEANAWGLHDMYGNVEEWCYDWYKSYSSNQATDPTGPSTGVNRILRGGAESASRFRSANRSPNRPNHRASSIGFRISLRPIE
jgi:serine/threonine protein kinase/formylglycine-generating enzyme required for sulfatase activity